MERTGAVATLIRATVGGLRTCQVTLLLEHDAEMERGGGFAPLIRATDGRACTGQVTALL